MSFRPNRDLLEPNFAGYKLATDTKIDLHQLRLDRSVDVVRLDENQFSYLHVRAFGLHNHLFADPCKPGTAYFVDSTHSILCCYQGDSVRKYLQIWMGRSKF